MNLEQELELIDNQIAELKAKRKEIKAKLPRKAAQINYVEFEAWVTDISFGRDYSLLPIDNIEGFSQYSRAFLVRGETKWNTKNKPKKGDKVLARIRNMKSGFNKVEIIKIIDTK